MAGYKKRRLYYRRRRKFAFYRAISNYHKTKLTYTTRLALTQTSCIFLAQNTNVLQLSACLSSAPDWDVYKNIFLSYKLTGIAFTAIPCPIFPNTVVATTTTGQFPVQKTNIVSMPIVGLISFTDADTYAGIAESNKSMILNAYNTTRAYWSLQGGAVSWDCTNAPNEQSARFATNVEGLPSDGELRWAIKIDFYIIYKITI